MTYYRVPDRPVKGLARPHLAVVVGALLLAMMGLPAFTTISVTVDGEPHRIERNSSTDNVVEQGLAHAETGDVVAMSGEVVSPGGGAPPTLARHGIRLGASQRIHNGDVLVSEPGLNVVEQQIATAAPIPIFIEYLGEGPLETVTSAGAEGLALQGVGAISGLVTSLGESRPAEPMVVERSYPRAGDKVVALTFDDGPWPGQTERILEILDTEGVPATFFVLGSRVNSHPELTARIAEEGHEVESHGYSHAYLTTSDRKLASTELRRSKYVIARATGVYPTWFRAPGGVLSDVARSEAKAAGMKVVRWDVDPQDWRKPPAYTLASNIIGHVRPGSVVLLHDGGGDRTSTINALTTVIRKLKAQGYTFVTLDEMGTASRS